MWLCGFSVREQFEVLVSVKDYLMLGNVYNIFHQMPPKKDDFTTSTQKPYLPATLRTEKSRVWAESDVTVCHAGKSCLFRGRIFVSGFEAALSEVKCDIGVRYQHYSGF
jgi:hypothetical protein